MTTGLGVDADGVHALLLDVLRGADLPVEDVGDRRVLSLLTGDHKRTIPVLLQVTERSLRLTSLFTGVPDEGHAKVYGLLLHRNERARHVHFALDDDGDLILTGRVPLAAVDRGLLDELLGELLLTADETFDAVLRIGFAGYLGHEQRWRAKAGLAPNPVGQPQGETGATS